MNNDNSAGALPAVENPCAFLPHLRAAYYTLLAGQAKAQVRYNDQWMTYHRADVITLEREVRRLEVICTQGTRGRAATVMGTNQRFSRY